MDSFEPDLLKTFLAFADGGSLARAAAAVGRSPSAVTAQMQRLEAQVGEPLLAPAGRGRGLTPTGEALVGHARRILAAHREAAMSLKGARADGRVGLGATQDFADTTLPGLLQSFARSHPRVRLDLRIGRSRELGEAFADGAIDILLAMRAAPAPDERLVLRTPMLWLSAPGGPALVATRPGEGGDGGPELPLALLDPPCGFRTAALAALDAAGRRYRIAATSPSLAGLRAAVRAGIAVTARTRRFLADGVAPAPARLALPALPAAEFSLRLRAEAGAAATDLAGLVADDLAAEDPARAGGRGGRTR